MLLGYLADDILTKLEFDNPKFLTVVYVTNQQSRRFSTVRGYNWFSGI